MFCEVGRETEKVKTWGKHKLQSQTAAIFCRKHPCRQPHLNRDIFCFEKSQKESQSPAIFRRKEKSQGFLAGEDTFGAQKIAPMFPPATGNRNGNRRKIVTLGALRWKQTKWTSTKPFRVYFREAGKQDRDGLKGNLRWTIRDKQRDIQTDAGREREGERVSAVRERERKRERKERERERDVAHTKRQRQRQTARQRMPSMQAGRGTGEERVWERVSAVREREKKKKRERERNRGMEELRRTEEGQRESERERDRQRETGTEKERERETNKQTEKESVSAITEGERGSVIKLSVNTLVSTFVAALMEDDAENDDTFVGIFVYIFVSTLMCPKHQILPYFLERSLILG